MKKDVIYIDIEDDITAIINKVKSAKAQIVALVPPRRVGVLQSTVNLKLLQRAAESSSHRIVLITNDQALVALAAVLSIPIAKNLQSKPEIAPIAALDTDDDDIIDGQDLPVGDLAGTVPPVTNADKATGAVVEPQGLLATASASAVAKPAKKAVPKIPNFDTFRKKLFLFGGLAVLLIAFFVWAIFFAAQAKVAITARTNIVNVSKTLQLRSSASLDSAQGVLPFITKQSKKTTAVDFTATGKKDVGERAVGVVELSTDSITLLGKTVPAGTQLVASNDLVYTTNAAVTFTIENSSGVDVAVTAVASGSKYNGASGGVSGLPKNVDGAFTSSTTGGTDKTVSVVTADDVSKAREKLTSQDSNAVKSELKKQFTANDVVIDGSFQVESADPVATPAIDQEATNAKLTAETTYTLIGVSRADLKKVYDEYLKTQLKGDNSQKVYQSGEGNSRFSQFSKAEGGYTLKATTVAQIGPNIDSGKLANDIRGKRKGEVQQMIGQIQGVEKVDVDLSPFWVSRVPGDTSRVKINFVVKNVD